MNYYNREQRSIAARKFIESLEQLAHQLTYIHQEDLVSDHQPTAGLDLSLQSQTETGITSQAVSGDERDSMSAFEDAAADIEQFIQTQNLESE